MIVLAVIGIAGLGAASFLPGRRAKQSVAV